MPYDWTQPPSDHGGELHLWPHQSLPPEGYMRFIGATAALITVPLLPLMGTPLFWGLIPFLTLAVFGMKYALDQNRRHAQIIEVLRLGPEEAELIRRDARGSEQSWRCNRHWTQVSLHPDRGPVPNYVTLRGAGREVEIGAFLSEDERKALYHDLRDAIRQSDSR
ncbi:hypothetical protein TM1040_2292 [Ruegeria sp. TM1040]|jgi:uncharacterized membrane protein|uniref:DUF2244 domain-containing protein n=1 Tax=Ruegeria sp. (strain TM1040) TaxID=292414 RepID=UPI0000462F1C|nr:DUF2244 domain-containing protein [Ruegeria sp. TM1040]ABF65024.1 hypothetical protein TM1040_2292 [Ruegeria sp. TM1040]